MGFWVTGCCTSLKGGIWGRNSSEDPGMACGLGASRHRPAPHRVLQVWEEAGRTGRKLWRQQWPLRHWPQSAGGWESWVPGRVRAPDGGTHWFIPGAQEPELRIPGGSIVFKFCFYNEREIYRLWRGRK